MKVYARSFFLITTLLGITFLTLEIGEGKGVAHEMAGSALALGFLLLFAFLLGRLAKRFGAPMITGYLIAGAIAGPYGLDIVTAQRALPLKLVDSLALVLIAISAGGELKISRFANRLTPLLLTTAIQTGVIFMFVFSLLLPVLAISGMIPVTFASIFSAALLLGVIATANSPATAIAVITESRAKGPVSDTIIGVTVFKDALVIVLFGFAVAVADALLGVSPAGFGFLWRMVYEVTVSIGVGGIIGLAVIGYLGATDENVPLFLLGAALVMVEICEGLEISPLMTAITAGFVVENLSKQGERLIEGLKVGSLPVFVIFFSLAGQGIDFDSLKATWPVATLFVIARIVGARIGTIKGIEQAKENPDIGKYAWTGFIGQAGVSLGFAAIVASKFPGFGEKLASLVIAAVAINQLIGPIMMKRSLKAAGETEAKTEKT